MQNADLSFELLDTHLDHICDMFTQKQDPFIDEYFLT